MEADKTGRTSCEEKSAVLFTKPEGNELFQNPKLRWKNDIQRLLRLAVGL